jgi:hypothetical protein
VTEKAGLLDDVVPANGSVRPPPPPPPELAMVNVEPLGVIVTLEPAARVRLS